MRRLPRKALIIALGVAIGKCCQYAAVAAVGPHLGFLAASLVGVVPFVVGILIVGIRHDARLSRRIADRVRERARRRHRLASSLCEGPCPPDAERRPSG